MAEPRGLLASLIQQEPLSHHYHDHPLRGTWKGYREQGKVPVSLGAVLRVSSWSLVCLRGYLFSRRRMQHETRLFQVSFRSSPRDWK